MVQCEMCGAETASPSTIKVEGAELDVCDDCTDFGTEVRSQESSSTSTKYSTSSSSGSGGSSAASSSSSSSSSSSGSRRRTDMFDQMGELAPDYGDRIRAAREAEGSSQEELAKELNEKASLIRKLERGDVLPSDDVQRKLERGLGISLTAEGGDEDSEWESETSGDGLTLGDMVKRKD